MSRGLRNDHNPRVPKPDDASLNLVVIGLGQAGGNLAAEFFLRGYSALALNTARTDLDSLNPGGVVPALPEERRLYIGQGGDDGAGADPSYGKSCIEAHADTITQTVMRHAEEADVLILAAGLGGGTGSAVEALVKLLIDRDLPILTLLTLPTDAESGVVKVNAVRALSAVINSPIYGWIVADNAQIARLHPELSMVDYFKTINKKIIEPLDALNRLNGRKDLKPIRSFDGEDFRKLLLASGIVNYGIADLQELSLKSLVEAISRMMEESELMPSGFELSECTYLGWVLEAPSAALELCPASVFEQLSEALKRSTGGAGIYQGIYRSLDDGPIRLRLFASVRAMPSRIDALLGEAKEEGSALGRKMQTGLSSLELGELDDLDLLPALKANPARRKRSTRPRMPTVDLLDHMNLAPPSPRAPARRRSVVHSSELSEGSDDDADTEAQRRVPTNRRRGGTADLVSHSEPESDDDLRRVAQRALSRRPNPRERSRMLRTDAAATADLTPESRVDSAPESAPSNLPENPPENHADSEPSKLPENRPDMRPGSRPENLADDLADDLGDEVDRAFENSLKPSSEAPTDVPEWVNDEELLEMDSDGDVLQTGDALRTGDAPKIADYEALEARFRAAKDPAEAQAVVVRLRQDAIAPSASVRFLAVQSMLRLNDPRFQATLELAREDPDETVQQLATEGLAQA